MTARRRYWLMKSEPDTFSIDDLQRVGVEPWNGVRNYQARNYMRDGMKTGDGVLFYHSNDRGYIAGPNKTPHIAATTARVPGIDATPPDSAPNQYQRRCEKSGLALAAAHRAANCASA